MKCDVCDVENPSKPTLCASCGARLNEALQLAPDPEDLAFRLWESDDKLFHTRLNYWIVSEGILLAAYASVMGTLTDWYVEITLFVIAASGITLTLVWYGLLIRSCNWVEHWFNRARIIHEKRHDKLVLSSDPESEWNLSISSIIPHKDEFNRKGLPRGGLRARWGIYILGVAFIAIWCSLLIISLILLANDPQDALGST